MTPSSPRLDAPRLDRAARLGLAADMFGRRRGFFIGCTIFAALSLLGGAAPSIGATTGLTRSA